DVIYSFIPLTIDLYEKYVKQHLIAPTPYLDLQDLKRQIVATKESAW
ncbi:MAG: hypothetical protein HY225_03600, partial [Candidatus Vogelbacteria bacterium]|nr:hypothetical protein [Candidatus Vogelbacteria bacterium]